MGQPEMSNSPAGNIPSENLKDCWVKVQVQVAIDVIHGKAGILEFKKLRFNFGQELGFDASVREIANPNRDGVEAEPPLLVHEIGDFFFRKSRVTEKQREVEPDAECGSLVGQGDRFVESRFVHHQAGARQNAFVMGADDSFVDAGRRPEVVGVDDESARADGRSGEG
jgi:hypothetical protein